MTFNQLFGLGPDHLTPDAALSAYWPLQDNAASTFVEEVSGNGYNGTATFNTADRAVAGPNGWLSGSLDFNGSTDQVEAVGAALSNPLTNNALTMLYWSANNNTAQTQRYLFDYADPISGSAGAKNRYPIIYNYNTRQYETFWTDGGIRNTVYTIAANDTTWHNTAISFDGGLNTIRSWIDGVPTLSNTTETRNLLDAGFDYRFYLGGSFASNFMTSKIAGVSIFSRALVQSEVLETYAGPEPVNISTPVTTGIGAVGETLTCNGGLWGLPSPFNLGSNGDVSLAYQWTRSDDATGTNEADIAGATAATYQVQLADNGKWLRCRVAATNDGGNDPASDTPSNFVEIGEGPGPIDSGVAMMIAGAP